LSTPDQLKYTATHTWLKAEDDGTYSVGITFHAQEQLGDVVYVECPAVGRQVKQGEACGVIESVKTAADIYAPLSGEIAAINEALGDAPESINQGPYAAWIFRIKPAHPAELTGLLDAAGYDKVAQEQ
jgi:glycine cleavage system H protein